MLLVALRVGYLVLGILNLHTENHISVHEGKFLIYYATILAAVVAQTCSIVRSNFLFGPSIKDPPSLYDFRS